MVDSEWGDVVELITSPDYRAEVDGDPVFLSKLVKDMYAEITRIETTLLDPHAVMINMMRGGIAVPHAEEQLKKIVELKTEADAARLVIMSFQNISTASPGAATHEQKETARKSPAYKKGNMELRWVGIGDMMAHTITMGIKAIFMKQFPR